MFGTAFLVILAIVLLILIITVVILCAKAAEYLHGDAKKVADYASARLYFIYAAVAGSVLGGFIVLMVLIYIGLMVFGESETAGLLPVNIRLPALITVLAFLGILTLIGVLAIIGTVKIHEASGFNIISNPGTAYEYGILASVMSIGTIALLFVGWIIYNMIVERQAHLAKKAKQAKAESLKEEGESEEGTEMIGGFKPFSGLAGLGSSVNPEMAAKLLSKLD